MQKTTNNLPKAFVFGFIVLFVLVAMAAVTGLIGWGYFAVFAVLLVFMLFLVLLVKYGFRDRTVARYPNGHQFSCRFCLEELPRPTDWNKGYTCPDCGAFYVIELPEDTYVAQQNAAEHFEVEFEDIETKEFKFETDEHGNVYYAIFGRPKAS